MHRYSVQCRFDREDVADAWVTWLRAEHIRDVLDAGAVRAELVRLDDPRPAYRIDYDFPDRTAYDHYIAAHADRLRAEGLERFPIELGLDYGRSNGDVIAVFPPATQ